MIDDLSLDPVAMEAHAARLDRIASRVNAVASAASLRVGDGDYGAAFGWFASVVNDMLAATEESIKTHSTDIAKNVSGCRKTIDAYQVTDGAGATGVNRAGGA
ncbi:hypothetical protein FK268_00265 [Tsukamurella sputi]|uniref:ESX-1 secretion-associated protein n=1 Tax=Tsukamurella sputi TaxID=2591848 RepID=A0A5C5RU72_9ACTN|nr:type VII secretion target [Tsukamurella sputi]TWS25751.1 hypothetical protein FK268_00265 [Tsukamurella sputi]